jgi:hypothetical protein
MVRSLLSKRSNVIGACVALLCIAYAPASRADLVDCERDDVFACVGVTAGINNLQPSNLFPVVADTDGASIQASTQIPGGTIEYRIQIQLKQGTYDQIRVVAEFPPYWIGLTAENVTPIESELTRNWTQTCKLGDYGQSTTPTTTNPWNYYCEWVSPPNYIVRSNDPAKRDDPNYTLTTGWNLTLRSQPYAGAEGLSTYLPTWISGAPNGRPLGTPNSDRVKVTFEGQSQLVPGIGATNNISFYIAGPSPTAPTYICKNDATGQHVVCPNPYVPTAGISRIRGRAFMITYLPTNYVPTISQSTTHVTNHIGMTITPPNGPSGTVTSLDADYTPPLQIEDMDDPLGPLVTNFDEYPIPGNYGSIPILAAADMYLSLPYPIRVLSSAPTSNSAWAITQYPVAPWAAGFDADHPISLQATSNAEIGRSGIANSTPPCTGNGNCQRTNGTWGACCYDPPTHASGGITLELFVACSDIPGYNAATDSNTQDLVFGNGATLTNRGVLALTGLQSAAAEVAHGGCDDEDDDGFCDEVRSFDGHAFNRLTVQGCPALPPSTGGTALKGGWAGTAHSNDYKIGSGATTGLTATATDFTVSFGQPLNFPVERFGPTAVIDYLPPFTELRARPTPPADFTQWFCRFDRKLIVPPDVPATCQQADSVGNVGPCDAGAPLAHYYRPPTDDECAACYPTIAPPKRLCVGAETPATADCWTQAERTAYLAKHHLPDPMSIDPNPTTGVAYPDGAVWSPTEAMGCVPEGDVCWPSSVNGFLGTIAWEPAGHCAGKKLRSDEVTAILWQTGPAGWLNRSYNADNPALSTRHSFSATYSVQAQALRIDCDELFLAPAELAACELDSAAYDQALALYPEVAWTLNFARIGGGDFDHDGNAQTALQNFDAWIPPQDQTYLIPSARFTGVPAGYSYGAIDNRKIYRLTLGLGGATHQPGVPGYVTAAVGQSVLDPSQFDWPPFYPIGSSSYDTPGTRFAIEITLPPGFEPAPFPTSAQLTTANHNKPAYMINPGLANAISDSLEVHKPDGSVVVLDALRYQQDTANTYWLPSRPTADVIDARANWDAGTGTWKVTLLFPSGDLRVLRTTPLLLGMVAPEVVLPPGCTVDCQVSYAYPFTQVNQTVAGKLLIEGYDLPALTDPNTIPYGPLDAPTDADDISAAAVTANIVLYEGLSTEFEPTCVDGSAFPAYDVTYTNSGAPPQFGLESIFIVPQETTGGSAVRLSGLTPPTVAPPVVTPGFQVTCADFDFPADYKEGLPDAPGTDCATHWVTYTAGMDLSPVRAVRVRHADNQSVPGLWAGTYQARLVVIDPHVDDTITTRAYAASAGSSTAAGDELTWVTSPLYATPKPLCTGTPNPDCWNQDQIDDNNALLTVLGTCPVPLTITKWFDRNGDRDAIGDAAEPPLPGVPFEIDLEGGSSRVCGESTPAGVECVSRTTVNGSTDVAGQLVVLEVWPEQVVTTTETLPGPTNVVLGGYVGPVGGATVTWAATTDGALGGTRQTSQIGWAPASVSFGNRCSCATSNQCVTLSGDCDVQVSGLSFAAVCGFQDNDLDCSGPAADVCEVATNACDPASGDCGVTAAPCDGERAAPIFVTIDGPSGPIGVAHCTVTAGGPPVCVTHDEGGVQVLTLFQDAMCQ